jgi:hypothetical protein
MKKEEEEDGSRYRT